MWEGNESIEISAPPERIWEIVSDLSAHPRLAGSGEVLTIENLTGPLAVGTTWESAEKVPKAGSFTAKSEVTEFNPPKVFAWVSHPPPLSKRHVAESTIDAHWRFDLEPSGGGTRVTNSFRVVEPKVGAMKLKLFYALTGRPKVIRRGMRKTLENLKAAAEKR
jgi:uncharacterized protein YndB with AHSA1/START domain